MVGIQSQAKKASNRLAKCICGYWRELGCSYFSICTKARNAAKSAAANSCKFKNGNATENMYSEQTPANIILKSNFFPFEWK